MSRSLKKGPYITVALEKKILAMNESGKKSVVKTWARASMISPDFVGHTIALPRTWWATSSESSRLHAVSAAMPVTRNNRRKDKN